MGKEMGLYQGKYGRLVHVSLPALAPSPQFSYIAGKESYQEASMQLPVFYFARSVDPFLG
jgi:hypothetical protein